MTRDEKPTIDLARAAEKHGEAQEDVKLAHAAMQSCSKAWEGIKGPSDARRSMYRAFVEARAGFRAACKREEAQFRVLDEVTRQGELFEFDGGPSPESGARVEPEAPRPRKPPGTALARRKKDGPKAGASAH